MATFQQMRLFESKDLSGLVTTNMLGAAYAYQPQFISNEIEQLYMENVGADILSLLKTFPIRELDEDQEYFWWLQGRNKTNTPLIAAYADMDGTALPTKPGIAWTRFVLEFGVNIFKQTDIVVGAKPDLYSIRLCSDGVKNGSNYRFWAELITGDETLFIPQAELVAGKKFSKDYSLAPQTLSDKGGGVNVTSPFAMSNIMSMIRKEYAVPGDMITSGKNAPMAFYWKDDKGKVIKQWISYLDWVALSQFRTEQAKLLMFGKSNKKSDGSYATIAENGYTIRSGSGFREQISGSNRIYYNTFTVKNLQNVLLDLSINKIKEDKRNFTLLTGAYGEGMIDEAIANKVVQFVPNYVTNRVFGSGQNLGYGGQFKTIKFPNGIVANVINQSFNDDDDRNSVYHPDGGLAESRRITIMDLGTTDGKPNIQLVRKKNQPMTYSMIKGLRDPYSPAGALTKPNEVVSKVDGYEIIYADWLGLQVNNPNKIAEFIPSQLR